MRFKIGDKVEVMNKEMPVSWLTAEIVSYTSHTYSIQYDSYPNVVSDRRVEIVSRNLVRPCPPLKQGVGSFVAGHIVEVFFQNLWRPAAILNILRVKKQNKRNKIHLAATFHNQYLVRLLGSSQELIIDRSNIRMRQTWHGDKWSLMGKSSQAGDDVMASRPSTSNSCRKMDSPFPQHNASINGWRKDCGKDTAVVLRNSPVKSSRSLKRMSPYGSSIVEAQNGHAQKLRAVDKEGWKQRVVSTRGLEKVDAVAYPKETLGDKNMHFSNNIISNGYNQVERTKQNDVLGCSGVRRSELSSSDSDASSVGSCSVTNENPKNYYSRFIPLYCQESDTLCSDAESSYGSATERKGLSLSPKEELDVSIRSLELHAYRSTLVAFYASGSFTWEREALLTNLRIMLHISNDEHLKELKQLISTKSK